MSKVNIKFNASHREEEFGKIYQGDYVLLQKSGKEPSLFIYDYDNTMKSATNITDIIKIKETDIYVNDIIHNSLKEEIKVLGICDISINIYNVRKYRK